MFRIIRRQFSLLKTRKKIIIQFEIFYKLIATCITYPLIIFMMNVCMKISGVNYLTNEYILTLIANPAFFLFVFILIILVVLYCAYEMAFLFSCFEFNRRETKAGLMETAYTALLRMKSLFYPANIPLNLFYFILIIFINFSIVFNMFYSQTILNLARQYVFNVRRLPLKLTIIAALIIIYIFVIFGVFSFQLFITKNLSFKKAYCKSKEIVKHNFIKINIALIGYNLLVMAAIGLFYVLISLILIAGVKLLDMAYMGTAIYLSVLKHIRTGMKIFLLYVAIPLSYSMLTKMFYKYIKADKTEYDIGKVTISHLGICKKCYYIFLVISIVLNMVYIASTFNNKPFQKIAVFRDTSITAHRGDCISAPENTLKAFEIAIQDMADYIELDVRKTLDGELVVMHDDNAYRTTGVDQKISEMTLEDVKKLNAANYLNNGYYEPVPTLDEVMRLVKKRVRINIEIKSEKSDSDIAKDIVKIIEKYNAADTCVVSSFDYNILKDIKKYNDKIQTGYILSVAYGDFYNIDGVDFFSVNASFLSKRTVDAIHYSGKEVYAWTVNNETSIKNLVNKGVDNIITDKPILARETIYSRDTSESLRNMIKYVFNQ